MIIRRWLLIVIISILLVFSFTRQVNAESSYVLPYPSTMPGSMLYKLKLLQEQFQKLWYFGSFGKYVYNTKQADKYLVEAKTLFEYKQYLLGSKALEKSNYYFSQIKKSLTSASQEKKDIIDKKNLLSEEAKKHIEILTLLQKELPEKFIWQPENSPSETLLLHNMLEEAISIREKAL